MNSVAAAQKAERAARLRLETAAMNYADQALGPEWMPAIEELSESAIAYARAVDAHSDAARAEVLRRGLKKRKSRRR